MYTGRTWYFAFCEERERDRKNVKGVAFQMKIQILVFYSIIV